MTTPAATTHGHVPTSKPSPWVERFAPLVPAGALVLDIAAGHGRHARFFAARGARVVAVDRDADALSTLQGIARIETRVLDLESGPWPLSDECFDVIVVTNYLHRPSLPSLLAALSDNGLLIYETFARGNEQYGRPSNPDFLLQKDELLRLVEQQLTVVAFEQGVVAAPPSRAVVQRLAAVGPGRAWPPPLPSS
jgi:SAM-dependent methyltransferase